MLLLGSTSDDTIYYLAVQGELGSGAAASGTWVYYSKPWNANVHERKKISRVDVEHYTDAQTANSTSNLGISWFDTDTLDATGLAEANFSTVRNVDLAKYPARIHRAGAPRQRIWKLTFDGSQKQIVKGLVINHEILRG
jgi:hypothetical protein